MIQYDYPRVEHFKYFAPCGVAESEMEFRLTYEGPLPSPSRGDTRSKYKHQIRKQLHGQLAQLWRTNHHLKPWVQSGQVEEVANNFSRCGFRFVPLVRENQGIVHCAINILFLRRDAPGRIVGSGGDIDNRLKVLFDGLRIPRTCDEVQGLQPGQGEDPFFCLLEDDALITEVTVTTDILFRPLQGEEHINDVLLIIGVKIRGDDPEAWTFRD